MSLPDKLLDERASTVVHSCHRPGLVVAMLTSDRQVAFYLRQELDTPLRVHSERQSLWISLKPKGN